MKRWFACALALTLFACDTSAPPEATPETTPPPRLDDEARRARAEAIVAKAKARQRVDALAGVELSADEEAKIREAAAAEVDAEDVSGELDALEAALHEELGMKPPK